MRKVYPAAAALGVLALLPWLVTQAIFTDSADVGSNTFTTGTVDISTSPASALVTYSNMAPGDSTTASLTVTNGGTLGLRYAISSSATNPDGKGLKDQLVLTIKTVDVTTPAAPCDNFDGTQLYSGDVDSTDGKLVGDAAQGAQAGDRTLAAGASEVLCFRVALPVTTGNAYQSASTTVTSTFSAEQTANNP
ncbi:MAG TPA: TasA family protein [Actinomycetota bacterium]|nr:TasA family protein [Actinomycetota bacterium]